MLPAHAAMLPARHEKSPRRLSAEGCPDAAGHVGRGAGRGAGSVEAPRRIVFILHQNSAACPQPSRAAAMPAMSIQSSAAYAARRTASPVQPR